MKMKCENIVTCGNYNCELNYDGACIRTVVALDGNGKCAMYKPKDRPTQNKPNKPYDVEASK